MNKTMVNKIACFSSLKKSMSSTPRMHQVDGNKEGCLD